MTPPLDQLIRTVRNKRVILSPDLASIYGVSTKALNQAVRRNSERFPEDFAFQLTKEEFDSLRSQIVTLKKSGPGQHRQYLPIAFTDEKPEIGFHVREDSPEYRTKPRRSKKP